MEALQQRLFIGVEIDDLDGYAGVLKAAVDILEVAQLPGEVTGVDADRHLSQPARRILVGGFLREREQQANRQVVDAVKAQVFQNM